MPLDQREPEDAVMSFGDHLEELRKRLFLAALVPLPLAIGLFFVAPQIRAILTDPVLEALRAEGLPAQLQVMSPIESLAVDMKLSLIGAIVVSLPWVLYQVWRFISPGLYAHERRFANFLVPLSTVLAACGLALMYFAILPLMLRGLIAMSGNIPTLVEITPSSEAVGPTLPLLSTDPASPAPGSSWVNTTEHTVRVAVPYGTTGTQAEILSLPMVRPGTLMQVYHLSNYISLIIMLALGTALSFQVPVVTLLLGWMGLVDAPMLRKWRKFAFFGALVVAAIVGPGDILSLLLLTGPLYLLYELGILLLVFAPASRVALGAVTRGLVGLDRGEDSDRSNER
ncbi:MAG: twin-arginine translocase subunit TatC [Planctomycetota bacterium]